MIRLLPISTRTVTLCPDTTLFRTSQTLPRAARSPKIPSMRRDVDHLPAVQRDELDRVQRVLMEEFAEAIAKATSQSRKNGKILKRSEEHTSERQSQMRISYAIFSLKKKQPNPKFRNLVEQII